MFENLKNELKNERDNNLQTWRNMILSPDGPETALKSVTDTRRKQYKAGKINRRQLNDFALKRVEHEIDKSYNSKIYKLNRVAQAADPVEILIKIEYSKKRNAHAEITVYTADGKSEKFSGHAYGFGYDKGSSALADALDKSDSIMKALYAYKDARLAQGYTDEDSGTVTGVDNRDIIGYGAGYNILPYFEGAVGVNCYWAIFEKLGFQVASGNWTEQLSFYTITRKETAAE